MGLSFDNYQKMMKSGQIGWNMDIINGTAKQINDMSDLIRGQQTAAEPRLSPGNFQEVQRQYGQINNNVAYMRAYSDFLKQNSPEDFDALSAHLSEIDRVMTPMSAWIKQGYQPQEYDAAAEMRQAQAARSALHDMRQKGMSAEEAGAQYGIDSQTLNESYKAIRAQEKRDDLAAKYDTMTAKELVAAIKSPDALGEMVYEKLREKYDDKSLLALASDKANDWIFDKTNTFGLSTDQIKEIIQRRATYNDHHYDSARLSDEERGYILDKLLEKSSVNELEQIRKELPEGSLFDDFRKGIDDKMQEKKMDEYYLNVLEKYPDAGELIARFHGKTAKSTAPSATATALGMPDMSGLMPQPEKTSDEKRYEQMIADGVDVEQFKKWRERYQAQSVNKLQNLLIKAFTQSSPAAAAAASVASVPMNMVGSLVHDVPQYIGANIDRLTGGDGYIDTEGTINSKAQAVRDATMEMMGDNHPLAQFLYSTGMSMGESGFAMLANAIPVVGPAISNAMFFSNAGVSAANDVINNGGSLEQATATMVAFGAVELVTERFSLEKLKALQAKGNVKSAKELFLNTLKQGATEGSEEVAATLADSLADGLINRDNSEFNRNIKAYMEQGLSREEAERRAWGEWLKGLAMDAAGGALSGAIFGGATSTVNFKAGKQAAKVGNLDVTQAELADLAGEDNKEAVKTAEGIVKKQGVSKVLEAAKLSENEEVKQTAAHFEEVAKKSKLDEGDVAQLLVKASQAQIESNRFDAFARETGAETRADYIEKSGKSAELLQNYDLSGAKLAEDRTAATSSFGAAHPNGVAAVDQNGKQVVVTGIDSSVPEYGRNDNTVSVVLSDGRTVDAGGVTFDNSDIQRLVNMSARFDSVGARALLANYEEAAQSGVGVDAYEQSFARLYEIAQKGSNFESLRQNAAYGADIAALGENVARAAVAAGLADGDISSQTRSFFQKRVRVKGRKFSESKVHLDLDVKLDRDSDVFSVLQGVAEVTGKKVVVTHALNDDDKGVYVNNTIYINANQAEHAMVTAALHEAVHNMRAYSEEDFRTLQKFVMNYLVAGGRDVERMLDSIAALYGKDAPNLDVQVEELVCKTVESLAANREALETALDVKQNKSIREKVGEILQRIADKVMSYFKGDKANGLLAHNRYAQVFLDDVKALQQMAQIVRQGFENAKANEREFGSKESEERFSKIYGIPKNHVFPPYDESKSDANEQAMRWARLPDVSAGDQRLASYHGRWYIIEKFDDMPYGYQIVDLVEPEHIENVREEMEERRERRTKERMARKLDGFDNRYRRTTQDGGERSNLDSNVLEYSTENNEVRELGKNEVQGRHNSINPDESAVSGDENRQGNGTARLTNGPNARKSKDDTIYLSAVERGDMETAQRMVDEAAMQWNAYSVDGKSPLKVFHGTLKGGFNKFGGRHDYWYFSNSKEYSNVFAGYKENGEPSHLLKTDTEHFYNPKIYEAYLKIQKPFITDDIDIIEDAFYWDRALPETMRSQGYDALMLKDLSQIIVLYPENIKSADPVTYDDNGNVIPLSARFNKNISDIRYSKDDTIYSGMYEDGDLYFGEPLEDDDLPFDFGEDDGEEFYYSEEDNKEKEIDVQRLMDDYEPREVVYRLYNATESMTEKVIKGYRVKLPRASYEKVARSVMRKFGIREKYNKEMVGELADTIENYIRQIARDKKSEFSTHLNGLATACRRYLEESVDYTRGINEEIGKDIANYLHGATILITPFAESHVMGNHNDSLKSLRRALGGYVNVGFERDAYKYKRPVYMDDVIDELASITGGGMDENYETHSPLFPDGERPDSLSGWSWLENVIDTYVRPQYIHHYGKEADNYYYESVNAAAAEMALEINTAIAGERANAARNKRSEDKKSLQSIDKRYQKLLSMQKALSRSKEIQQEKEIEKLKARVMKERGLKEMAREDLDVLKSYVKSDTKNFREQYAERQKKNAALRQLGQKFNSLTKRLDGKANKNAYIPETLKKPILEFLELFDADPGNYKNGKPRSENKFKVFRDLTKVKERVNALAEEYARLEGKTQFEDALGFDINALAFDKGILNELRELGDLIGEKNVYQLNSDELYTLLEVMNDLDNHLKHAVEIIVDGQKTTIEDAAKKGIDEMQAVYYKKDSKNIIADWLRDARNRFVATSLDPVRYGKFLSGYKEDAVWNKLMNDLHHGDQKRIRIMQEAYSAVQTVTAKYSRKDLQNLQRKAVSEFTMKDTETGEDVKLSQGMLLTIYLTDKQADGHRHLCANRANHYTLIADLDKLNGNRVLPDVRGKKQKAEAEYGHKVQFTAETLERIQKYVESTPILTDMAAAMHKVLNGLLADEINMVSMQRYGKLIATVKNYFPIRIDHGDTNKKFETSFEGENIFTDQRMKSRGFTKQRTWSDTAIVIGDAMNVFQRHVNETAEYCGMLIPVENIKKVINSDNGEITVRTEITRKFGGSAIHYLNKLLGEIQQRKDTIDENLITSFSGHAMGAALAFNPRSWLKNYGALPLAYKHFGAGNVAKAVAATKAGWGKIGKDLVEKYNAYTPYMWYREQGNGTVVGELSRQHGLYGKFSDSVDMMGKFDRAVVNLLLYASEENVKQTTKLEVDSEEFKKEVAKRFEKCVDESQPNSMITSKPQFVRNNVMRVLNLNAFASQRMAMGNSMMDSFMEFRARSYEAKMDNTKEAKTAKKKALKDFVYTFFGVVQSAGLQGLLGVLTTVLLFHKWDDLKDEEGNVTLTSALLGGGKMILKDLPEEFFGSFAWMDRVYSFIEKRFDKNAYGSDFNVMSFSAVEDIVKSIDSGNWAKAWGRFADLFGLYLIGGGNQQKLIQSGYSYFNDIINGRLGFTGNNGKTDFDHMAFYIINAYDSGNSSKGAELTRMWVQQKMSEGQAEAKATENVNKKLAAGLAQTETARQAMTAGAGGNYGKAEKLKAELVGKGFSQDLVDAATAQALRDVYAMLKDVKPKDREEAESILLDYGFDDTGAAEVAAKWESQKTTVYNDYRYSDAFNALKNGDKEGFEVVKSAIVTERHNDKQEYSEKDFMSQLLKDDRTKPLFEELEAATDGNDRKRLERVRVQLLNVFGSESEWRAAYQKYLTKKNN